MALRGNPTKVVTQGIRAGLQAPMPTEKQTALSFDEEVETPVVEIPDNSTLVDTKKGIQTIGQTITEKMLPSASTKEEAQEVINLSNEAQKDAELNSELLSLYGSGKILAENVGFERGAERVPTLSKQDFPMDAFMYGADEKERMIAEARQRTAERKLNATAPVLEKMGIEEYYPDISRGISVGSISSQMLGSRNRYVSQGNLIPWGVVDARARAIEKDVAEKAAIAGKIKNQRLITTPQYQQVYDDYFMDKQNEFLDIAGNDTSLLLDPTTQVGREYLNFMTTMENSYKENLEVDKAVDAILEKHDKGDYIPEDILSFIDEWDTGRLNMDEYIGGSKRISQLVDNIKSYESTRTYMDEKLKDLESEKDVMPLKAGVDFNNPTVAKNAADALKKKSGSSYDEYLSAVGEFYDVEKLKNVIDGAYSTSSRFYKGKSAEELSKLKADALDYMLGSLGDKITVKNDTVANKSLEWAKFAYQKEQDKTFYTNNDINQKALGVEIQKINANTDLSAAEKKKQIDKLYANNINFDQEASNRFGFNVNAIPLGVAEQAYRTKATNADLKVNYGGKKAIPLSEVENEFNKLKKIKYSTLTAKQKDEYHELKQWVAFKNDVDLSGGVFELTAGKRYSTSFNTYPKDGKMEVAAGQWIDPKAPVQTMIIDEHNSVIVREEYEDKKTKEIKYREREIPLPGSARTYKNGSDDNVKYEFDAINTKTTDMTNKGD
jgi:hypothetical protein